MLIQRLPQKSVPGNNTRSSPFSLEVRQFFGLTLRSKALVWPEEVKKDP
jgi:hypothetical protein